MPVLLEYRSKPVNLLPEDDALFNQEYKHQLQEPALRNLKNCYVNSEGYAYQHYQIEKDGLRIGYDYSDSRLKNFIKCTLFSKGKINEPVIFIHDNWSQGYFHWFSDALPKLEFLAGHISLNDYKLLLPAHYLQYEYISASLNCFGFTAEKIIPLEYHKIYKCTDVTYCTQFVVSGNYYSDLMQKLSARIKNVLGCAEARSEKKIYISRANATKRKIVNEEEVLQVLEKFGFQSYKTEALSWTEQVGLLASAEWLVSIHGAGLTNMLFMRPGTNILEFRRNADGQNNCYFSLTSSMQLNYYYLNCEPEATDTGDHIGNLIVNTDKLSELLNAFLHKGS